MMRLFVYTYINWDLISVYYEKVCSHLFWLWKPSITFLMSGWVSVFPFTKFQMATGMKWDVDVVDLIQSKNNEGSSHTSFGLEGGEPSLNTPFTYRHGTNRQTQMSQKYFFYQIEIFCNIINVFIVTYDQFNAFLSPNFWMVVNACYTYICWYCFDLQSL